MVARRSRCTTASTTSTSFAGSWVREAISIQAVRRSGILRAAGYDIDDLYCAIVRFEDDVLATAELGLARPCERCERTVGRHHRGRTDGWLRVEQGQTGLECYAAVTGQTSRLARRRQLLAGGPRPDIGGPRRRSSSTSSTASAAGRAPVITVDDAIEALRLSLAMEHAAATSTTVDMTRFGVDRVA